MDFVNAGLAILVVLATAGLILVFTLPGFRKTLPTFRSILAVERLRKAIGFAVEDGNRIHIGLGYSPLVNASSASALSGLTSLERIAMLSLVSDRPPVATSADGGIAILSQDALRAAYRLGNQLDFFEASRGQLAGLTRMSYLAGVLSIIRSEKVAANFLLGHIGPETALMVDAALQQKGMNVVASDAITAQAAAFGMSQDVLIGEELFALPVYLHESAVHQASLRVQDVLRWLLIIVLLGAAALKLAGIL